MPCGMQHHKPQTDPAQLGNIARQSSNSDTQATVQWALELYAKTIQLHSMPAALLVPL